MRIKDIEFPKDRSDVEALWEYIFKLTELLDLLLTPKNEGGSSDVG